MYVNRYFHTCRSQLSQAVSYVQRPSALCPWLIKERQTTRSLQCVLMILSTSTTMISRTSHLTAWLKSGASLKTVSFYDSLVLPLTCLQETTLQNSPNLTWTSQPLPIFEEKKTCHVLTIFRWCKMLQCLPPVRLNGFFNLDIHQTRRMRTRRLLWTTFCLQLKLMKSYSTLCKLTDCNSSVLIINVALICFKTCTRFDLEANHPAM